MNRPLQSVKITYTCTFASVAYGRLPFSSIPVNIDLIVLEFAKYYLAF